MIWRLLCVLTLLGCMGAASGQAVSRNERKAILNALRAPVQKELKQKVIFEVKHLKAKKGWAFLIGVPRQKDGKAINYKKTPYREAVEAGAFDDGIDALLRKKKGKWRVVAYAIGPTDVAYEGWDKKYNAPSEIFR